MDEDVEDFVFYGTPIEREEDTSGRKRRSIAEAGQLRSLPPWKQEVRDEEGRKRFHGAFTGGFSAGYFNTAGSKEGWAPKTFTSSRKNRAEVKEQSIYNFLDDEDMTDMGGHALETSLKFDTFGFTAAELARKQAEKEQEQRPSTIPGPVPDELVLPAANSIGVKLLLKMGWRRGHSIRETHADSLSDARREARKAFLAFSVNEGESKPAEAESRSPHVEHFTERSNDDFITSQSTHVYVPNPKQNLHGLGYDPFKHAPEFRDRKKLNESTSKDRSSRNAASGRRNLLASNSGKYAPGFGIGALEELDVEDEDIYASGFDYAETEVEEVETTKAVSDTKHRPESRKRGALSGFKVASSSGYDLERFNPPLIPPDFEPLHKFPFPLEAANQFDESPPLEVPPPEDNTLRLLIDGFATLVARCGKLFEDLSKEKNRSNPFFSFLDGGNGHNYYLRKLWEEKQKKADLFKQDDMKASSSAQKMTAEVRGRILGEKSLEKSFDNSSSYVSAKETVQLQSNLSDTFTKPASQAGSTEHEKPFKADPAKQERFEQFLKDKYQGGLRSTFSRGNNAMSEADRARERLDFDAAAEAIAKGEWNPNVILQSTSHNVTVMKTDEQVSISGVEKREDEEKLENKIYPKREEYQWRPYPILCKRFDITDPFMGKPPPMPRARSRMDSLIFTADPIMTLKNEVTKDLIKPSMPISRSEPQGTGDQVSEKEPDVEPNNTSVQRPVDLYKAIFSDDSDDDGDNASFNPVNDSENREGVNTTLNRLIAGDFLESLGKELGLEVPKDAPLLNKVNGLIYSKETIDNRDTKPQVKSEKSTSALEMSNQHSEFKEVADRKAVSGDGDVPNHKSSEGNLNSGLSNGTANERVLDHGEKVEEEKMDRQSKRRRSHTKRHRRESSASDTDSSSHRESSYHSRSRREKKGASSEGKIRKHSSHYIHKRNRSPVSSDENDQKSRNRKRHSGYSKSHVRSKHR